RRKGNAREQLKTHDASVRSCVVEDDSFIGDPENEPALIVRRLEVELSFATPQTEVRVGERVGPSSVTLRIQRLAADHDRTSGAGGPLAAYLRLSTYGAWPSSGIARQSTRNPAPHQAGCKGPTLVCEDALAQTG